MADKFYKIFGFSIPEYCALNTQSALGKAFCQRIEDAQVSRKVRNQARMVSETKSLAHLVVMSKIEATPFNQLEKDRVVQIFIANVKSYPTVFRSLGRMLFLDTFCKNVDRLNWETCNTGNFLLDLTRLQEENPVCLIDHDFELHRPFVRNIEKNVRLLCHCFSPDNILLNRTIEMLYHDFVLNSQCDPNPLGTLCKSKFDFIKENMGRGVMQALEDLLFHFPDPRDDSLVKSILELPEPLQACLPYRVSDFFEVVKVAKEEKAQKDKNE
ncbi:MAG: hypothetical protein LLG04_08250 [Parachlamydia sp.]|nr:hypothetical protein [Parachlamydia sp.]